MIKEEIILLYMETNEKLSEAITQLPNQIIELVKHYLGWNSNKLTTTA